MALTLRSVAGLTVPEIARAFLSTDTAMERRLTRARNKVSDARIPFRVPTDDEQLEYQSTLRIAGYGVTPVRDRQYFHSIYYHEPGGVLFEIATEPPGFAIDEPINALGESLKLPPWLEPNRDAIEESLPALTLKPMERVR